jgi:PAS domain S-box-containing protein
MTEPSATTSTNHEQGPHPVDEAVHQERDRLKLVLSNVPNPIIVHDGEHNIVTMNPRAHELFSVPTWQERNEATERTTTIILGNSARFSSFLADLRQDPAADRRGELTLAHPQSGEPILMDVTSTEVRNEVGAVTAIVSVLHDLTHHRELERRRLERALFETEKLAATGRLAASIAHEINNPLEAIKNALYLMAHQTPEDDPKRRFLDIASKETERVARILSQMLGSHRSPRMAPTEVNGMILEAVALVEQPLRHRSIHVECDLDPDLPVIHASADQLKQVMWNLILNAQHAMPDGGAIHIATHRAGPAYLGRESVHIQIKDSGLGIAPEDLPLIFEPFFSTKVDTHGTGLGLWVSMGVVQNHGGTIKVSSKSGQGTTFTLALPIEGPQADADR